jgi:hypothetical protein
VFNILLRVRQQYQEPGFPLRGNDEFLNNDHTASEMGGMGLKCYKGKWMKQIPQKGMPKDKALAALRAMKKDDASYRDGRMFGLIYNAGDDGGHDPRGLFDLPFRERAESLRFPKPF